MAQYPSSILPVVDCRCTDVREVEIKETSNISFLKEDSVRWRSHPFRVDTRGQMRRRGKPHESVAVLVRPKEFTYQVKLVLSGTHRKLEYITCVV